MKNMKLDLALQNPFNFDSVPKLTDCQHWVEKTLVSASSAQHDEKQYALVVRFVDEKEGIALNHAYRHKDQATNVLSFPYEAPDFNLEGVNIAGIDLADEENYLGDLVLCEPVVREEALQQHKKLQQHWAHLIIHGTLHLKGYDHVNDEDATIMEALEVKILKGLGFNNPYLDNKQDE